MVDLRGQACQGEQRFLTVKSTRGHVVELWSRGISILSQVQTPTGNVYKRGRSLYQFFGSIGHHEMGQIRYLRLFTNRLW